MTTVPPQVARALTLGAARAALLEGLRSGRLELPVLPAIAGNVLTMSNDPDADVADLSDLIHKDQALAGNVLRIANSAAYCTGEPIVSLRQAVMRLGMGVLSEIAVAACLQGEGFRAPGYDAHRRRLLVHAFVAGGFAKELARQKRRNVEAMFLCGLLHSIGKPVVLILVATMQRGNPALLSTDDMEALVAEFHREAARAVTTAWKLPQVVQAAAVHHGDPEAARGFVDEVRTVTLAAHLATWALGPAAGDAAPARACAEWEPLNFYPDDIDAVLARRETLVASAGAFNA